MGQEEGSGERKGVCSRRGERDRVGETKMPGLYREDPGLQRQVGTEECWENLEARSALICKICTPVSCPRVQSQTVPVKEIARIVSVNQ